jgi:ApbE superfamily uncharacterized protein (UPF0280 family)
MKSPKYKRRFYRDWVYPKGLCRKKVIVRETDLDILSDKSIDAEFVRERIKIYRRQIEHYISRDERFLTSLKPLTVESIAAPIVKEMAKQSRKANVGPMACVAGAIAQYVGKDILRRGAKSVIIENGGDIFLKVSHPVKVGIYAGRSKLSGKLNLRIFPRQTPAGICTSSGTTGHSLSFGSADSVVIIAGNAALADAVATATANRVQSKSDLEKAIKFAASVKGVAGAVAILKNNLASWGRVEFAGG